MVQDWVTDLLAQKEEWSRELSQDFDFAALETKVGEALNRLAAEVLKGPECAVQGAGVRACPEGVRRAFGDAAQRLPCGEGASR